MTPEEVGAVLRERQAEVLAEMAEPVGAHRDDPIVLGDTDDEEEEEEEDESDEAGVVEVLPPARVRHRARLTMPEGSGQRGARPGGSSSSSSSEAATSPPLSLAQVNLLPQIKYKRPSREELEGERKPGTGTGDECSICLDEFVEGRAVTLLPCVHFFHSKCISSWLTRAGDCPACRLAVELP